MPFAGAEGYHSKTLAYSMWHIFRIEDIVAHTLIIGDEQILFAGKWQERTGSPIITTGNELTGDEIVKFSRRLDIKELYVNKETTPYCVSEKSLGDYQYDYTEKKYTRVITGTNLIVPLNCKEEYATTYPWDRFDTRYITERDLSGIKPATAKTSQPEDVFSLDGRRQAKTQQGLNIICYKDGTAKKVVAK